MYKVLIQVTGAIFALLMLIGLVGCAGADGAGDRSTAREPALSTPAERQQPERLELVRDGTTDYVIVRSASATAWELRLARRFSNVMQALTGVEIPVVSDRESGTAGAVRTEKEIVIGSTNRENELAVAYETIGDGYQAFVSYERLVLASRSEAGLYLAIRHFFQAVLSVDLTAGTPERLADPNVFVPADYQSTCAFPSGEIPFLNAELDRYVVSYVTGDPMQKRMAVLCADAFREATGASLPCVAADTPADTAFVLCATDQTGAPLGSGRWQLDVSGKTVYLRASDYYGFGGVAHYLKTAFQNGHYAFADGFQIGGDYIDSLIELTASSAYAYRRGGDNRVLFYNALWQNSADRYLFPTPERNLLQAQMIAQYLPDVIGFQEMDAFKRGSDSSLAERIARLGYAETLDPAVANEMQINYTPLFYNTNTTLLVKSAYNWYAAQDRNAGQDDRSSKALTWGVFENKRTGDRYLVISTHMCTRDDSVRGEQAKEALALIAVLVAEYDCPVILGGDLNGTSTSANYRLFTENGLLDVQKQAEVTSGVNTWHDYPSYDDERGMILPTAGARLGADSIDRILIANADRVSLKLFGVVVDACTLSASDHFPIFVDFSFSAGANAGG